MSIAEFNKKTCSRTVNKKEVQKGYHEAFRIKSERCISLIDNNPKKVLDVGCWDGWFGERIKNKFDCKVYGLDISKVALKLAKKRGLITKEFNLEGKRWPYKNNTFDVVLAGDIIEHLYDTEKFVSEAFRVLKKGGVFLVSTPNINCYYNRLLVFFGKMPMWIESAPNMVFVPFKSELWSNTGHVRVFNKHTMSKLLEHFGFKLARVEGIPFSFPKEQAGKYKKVLGVAQRVENFFGRFSGTASLLLFKAIK